LGWSALDRGSRRVVGIILAPLIEEKTVRERSGRVEEELKPANTEQSYSITRAELPLHCPLPGMYLWNSHPKVFLPIEVTGHAKCPYCGASYSLVPDDES